MRENKGPNGKAWTDRHGQELHICGHKIDYFGDEVPWFEITGSLEGITPENLNEIRAHLDLLAVEVFGAAPVFDLISHLHRQRAFSLRTFGPGSRLNGVLDHIRRELVEIENAPQDSSEWADLILLALDGAWRAGFEPEQIAAAIEAKQTKNEGRTWPDWRTQDPEKAICHINAAPAEGGKEE